MEFLVIAKMTSLAHRLQVLCAAILGRMVQVSNRQNDLSLRPLGKGAIALFTSLTRMQPAFSSTFALLPSALTN
jgi:hypothetical protein